MSDKKIMQKDIRPYMIPAFYEWILENDCTPHVLINAKHPNAVVPNHVVGIDGRVVLSLSPTAIANLSIDKDGISFDCRFGGKPWPIYLPMKSIESIFAAENHEGMGFEPFIPNEAAMSSETEKQKTNCTKEKPPFLKVIK